MWEACRRVVRVSENELVKRLLSGDRRALARIISRIEGEDPEVPGMISELYPYTGEAVANVDEESVAEGNRYSAEVEKVAAREGAESVRLSAKLEAEVAELPEEEAREYLAMLGVESTGFEGFIRAAYRLLGLITFFSASEKESRAWTVRKGSTARRAAGRIHSDMERGFIAAEVSDWEDLVAAGSWARAREEAKARLEGRDYVVEDGDTMLVRFNV